MNLRRPIAPEPYSLLPSVPSFSLTSEDIAEGRPMDRDFSTDGTGLSPQLSWSQFPAETRSFTLNCFDPDAPIPSGFWHWTIGNLPASMTRLGRNAGNPDTLSDPGLTQVRNDGGTLGFTPAAPPEGDAPHRYIFAIHALDVEHIDYPDSPTPAQVAFMSLCHTIARATLTGTYQR